jgi:hypothetical protein
MPPIAMCQWVLSTTAGMALSIAMQNGTGGDHLGVQRGIV